MSRCTTTSTTWELVGDGRVGNAIKRMAETNQAYTVVYERGQRVSERRDGPVLVCTRAEALSDVWKQTPERRKKDLCFLQNGAIETWLRDHQLKRNTRVALYMSATVDEQGNVHVEDGRRTVVTGPYRNQLCQLLNRGGVSCRTVERGEFQTVAAEKMLWGCVFWLISAANGGCDVGTVARNHRQAVVELVDELYPMTPSWDEMPQMETKQVVENLCSYSLDIQHAVPSPTMALQEWPWRNGWFWEQQPTEKHAEWLRKAALCLPELQEKIKP